MGLRRSTVLDLHEKLEMSGFQPPVSDPEKLAAFWLKTWGDTHDQLFRVSVEALIPKLEWWPKPGQITGEIAKRKHEPQYWSPWYRAYRLTDGVPLRDWPDDPALNRLKELAKEWHEAEPEYEPAEHLRQRLPSLHAWRKDAPAMLRGIE